MKTILSLSLLTLMSTRTFALDLKGKLIEAAKDKKNQEIAKEYAQKGVDYIKGDKKEEVKAEVKAEVAPVSATPPVEEKTAKKIKKKKSSKKDKNKKPIEVKTEEVKTP